MQATACPASEEESASTKRAPHDAKCGAPSVLTPRKDSHHSRFQHDSSLRILLQQSRAEAQTLCNLQHIGLAQGGFDIWDVFIVNMEAKDDTRPP
ncbi:hypothetical protein NDU88_003968 [Pleurodeles waltl]|uniref:Uncharacterized protein n=1 Tax=Pleurodeles waltl TaxID=8319 RepID=A0AAV7TQH3_PLEWA|nr:hypothetical protein NDU88_003968 [Pleurodeles waltl]